MVLPKSGEAKRKRKIKTDRFTMTGRRALWGPFSKLFGRINTTCLLISYYVLNVFQGTMEKVKRNKTRKHRMQCPLQSHVTGDH